MSASESCQHTTNADPEGRSPKGTMNNCGSGKTLWGIDPDRLKGKLPPFLPDVPEVRQDFADYLGEAQAFDAGLGALIEKLTEMTEFLQALPAKSKELQATIDDMVAHHELLEEAGWDEG